MPDGKLFLIKVKMLISKKTLAKRKMTEKHPKLEPRLDWRKIKTGVLQGTSLGLILFHMFIHFFDTEQ